MIKSGDKVILKVEKIIDSLESVSMTLSSPIMEHDNVILCKRGVTLPKIGETLALKVKALVQTNEGEFYLHLLHDCLKSVLVVSINPEADIIQDDYKGVQFEPPIEPKSLVDDLL